MDSNLKFTEHIKQLNIRLRKLVYRFYNLRHIMPVYIVRQLYYALVESLLRYGIVVWGGTYTTNIEPLRITQKYIIKVILFKNKRHSSALLFDEFNVYDIDLLYVCSALLFVYKHRELISPNILNTYSTRSQSNDNVQIPLLAKTTTQKFITYYGPKFYNLLPYHIKSINNRNLYAKKVKLYIAENTASFLGVLRPP